MTGYQLIVYAEEFVGAVYYSLSVPRQNSPVFRFVAEVAKKIENEPGASYDFVQIARENYLSYDHFRRRFLEYTGKPVHEFLLQKRLELSMSLLRESRNSIKEIAYHCGFGRQAEFSRFFKHRTGLTPTDFLVVSGFFRTFALPD